MACSDKFFVGETGSSLVVDAGVDLSSATEITLTLKRPNGVITEKTLGDSEISVGGVDYANTITGETYEANTYVIYNIEAEGSPVVSVLDVDGVWSGQLTYEVAGTPPLSAPGCIFDFTVLKAL